MNEIIDRRDQTQQNLLEVIEKIKELLDNLEIKTHEVQHIITYYEKIKSNFFVSKSSNLLHIFPAQAKINKDNLDMIEKCTSVWWSNMRITEDYLRARNLLSHQLVQQYTHKAKQYITDQEKNTILFAQKKNDEIKKQAQETEDKNKKGGGGGPEDPDDPHDSPPKTIGYFKNVFTHAFTGEKGHLIDTPTNRLLILEMTSNIKNFITKDVHGSYWYAEILKDGRQLWAWAREGFIRDCGINDIARAVTKYGLCKNSVIK